MGIVPHRVAGGVLLAGAAVLLSAGLARAGSAPCRSVAIVVAGRTARTTLRCHVQAARRGRPVDAGCLAHAQVGFARSFRWLERTRCIGPAAVSLWDAKINDFVADVLDALPTDASANRCVAIKLAAAGKKAADVLLAQARHKRRSNFFRLGRATQRANATFLRSFTGADGHGGCARGNAPVVGGMVDRLVDRVLCGDDVRDLGEECDGRDDAVCPGACQADCTCGGTVRFACLGGDGPLVSLAGTHTDDYRNKNLAAGARIDAREAIFIASPDNRYPINLGGGDGVCLAGGTVLGQYDRNLGWEAMHDINNAGVASENAALIADGVRIDNVTDGFRPTAEGFTIREAWLSYVRDDCVENDHLHGGLIEDSLFDGCYVGVSERPSADNLVDDGRASLLSVRRSLIRLQAMPGPREGAPGSRGLGRFFKWSERATQLALHDNVFLSEQVGQDGPRGMGMPDTLVSCSNNVMVWLGGGDYPAPLPACFTVTTDRAVWDAAVRTWQAQHPHVGPP
jgi:hypothetical protein